MVVGLGITRDRCKPLDQAVPAAVKIDENLFPTTSPDLVFDADVQVDSPSMDTGATLII